MSNKKCKEPSANILIQGLRSIGYSFQTAVADIIDNSITADAKEVRIFYDPASEKPYFSICDNGSGMSDEEFDNALDFGTKKQRNFSDKKDLGRFGLGLKTASLSQCKKLTVITKQTGVLRGAYWDVDDIIQTNSWQLTYLSQEEIEKLPNDVMNYLKGKESGTIVLWEKFDRIRKTTSDFPATMHRIVQSDVLNHCALVFHRFYDEMPIYINNERIPKRDPFLDESSRCISRPEMTIPTDTPFPIVVRAYRMPAENDLSKEEAELLGGKSSLLTDDGLYIYRNNRLIAWGSWMKLEHRNLYTHLARIKIDIPSSIDQEWGLDVKKSMAIIPDSIKEKIRPAIVDGIGQSKQRTRYSGKKEADLGIDRVWTRTTLENHKVKYELNQNYPSLEQLKDSLNSEQKIFLSNYLHDVVDFIPAAKMRDDVHDSLMALNGQENRQNDQVLINDLFSRVDLFDPKNVEQGVECIQQLLSTETFSPLKEKMAEVVKQYRRHYYESK